MIYNNTSSQRIEIRAGDLSSWKPLIASHLYGIHSETPVTGSNNAGTATTLRGGLGTGTGTPSTVDIYTPNVGSSGSTAHTETLRWRVKANDGVLESQNIGSTVAVKSGSNAKAGTFTLVAGTVTVSNTSVTANSVICVTLKTNGGTRAGNPDIVPTATTGFVATGAATDTSTYNYVIFEVN